MSQDMLDANNYDVSRTREYFRQAEERPVTILAPDCSVMLDTVHVTPETNSYKGDYYDNVNIYEGGGALATISEKTPDAIKP